MGAVVPFIPLIASGIGAAASYFGAADQDHQGFGGSLDPNTTMSDMRNRLETLLGPAMEKANNPVIDLPDLQVRPLPTMSGGILPFPIGGLARDYRYNAAGQPGTAGTPQQEYRYPSPDRRLQPSDGSGGDGTTDDTRRLQPTSGAVGATPTSGGTLQAQSLGPQRHPYLGDPLGDPSGSTQKMKGAIDILNMITKGKG